MKHSRMISLIILSALLTGCTIGCGGQSSSIDTSASGATSDLSETTADPLADGLPEKDFKGYEFRIYADSNNAPNYVPESEVGEIVNDAVYNRNRAVEERFNIKIKAVDSGALTSEDHRTKAKNVIFANDEICDIMLVGKHIACDSIEGYFLNLYDVEYLNFERPWWSQQLVEDMTFNNKMFICTSNLHYSEFAKSKVYFFNKDKLEDYGMDTPYQLVFDGKWTIDELVRMTKDVYEDVNGDNTVDTGDFFGMLTTVSHNSWAVVFDIPVWEKNGDKLECVAMSDKMLDAFDTIKNWYYESQGLYTWSSYGQASEEMRRMFNDGRGLFTFGFIEDADLYYRDTSFDYGIVPFPKYDENQENYRTFLGGGAMFGIPVFASDTDRTGIIVEAMSAEGYKKLTPVYYETALKDKYLRDEESIRILDIISAGRTISFSYYYDNWSAGLGFGNCFQSSYSESFATFYASRENIVLDKLAEVEAAFS